VKRLIINADDCGADKARNAGIFEAIEKGAVTGISILPNGPAFDDAVRRIHSLRAKDISCGLHVNLSEGRPLSSDLQSLIKHDGHFRGKLAAIKLLTSKTSKHEKQNARPLINEGWNRIGSCESFNDTNPVLTEEIKIELNAQMKKLIGAGISVDHIDGHHHVHIFPAVVEAVIGTARKYGIPCVRIPEEQAPLYGPLHISDELASEARLFSRYASEARIRIKMAEIRTTEHFRGLYLKGRLSLTIMAKLLMTLPDGITELMTHPGRAETSLRPGPFSTFSNRDREGELETLVHPDFPLLLNKYGVHLASFFALNRKP
jgi:predicted glycoside hydrolase/deacetylase ChbG (UPF0249 family)